MSCRSERHNRNVIYRHVDAGDDLYLLEPENSKSSQRFDAPVRFPEFLCLSPRET
jgi:hypothetical protein